MSLREALASLYSRYEANQLIERYTAAAKVVADEERRRVLREGDHVAPFKLQHPEHGHVSSTDLLQRGPLVLNFYRGLWCSYCQRDLLGTHEILPDLRSAGASVFAVTGGITDETRTKLKESIQVGFPIIGDTDGQIAEQFGLRWSAADSDLGNAAMGQTLITLRTPGPWILPMQARYLIRPDGVVAFANVAFSYDERSEPNAILSKLSALVDVRNATSR